MCRARAKILVAQKLGQEPPPSFAFCSRSNFRATSIFACAQHTVGFSRTGSGLTQANGRRQAYLDADSSTDCVMFSSRSAREFEMGVLCNWLIVKKVKLIYACRLLVC